jgi:multidrug efflux pump
VRGFLTTPIERAVSAIGGVDHIESTSRAGVSTVTIRLELGYDTTKALAEVTARLQQVRSPNCPPKPNRRSSTCSAPIVRTRRST